jgi:hypothetical protein
LVPGADQRIHDGAERHSDDDADGEVDDVADVLRKGSSRISPPHDDACANCASDNDIAVLIEDPATLTGEPRRLASVNAIFARNRRGDFRKARFAPGPIVNARGSCTICGGMESIYDAGGRRPSRQGPPVSRRGEADRGVVAA